jgi:hypothetical protein
LNTIPDHDGGCPPRPVPVPSQNAALLALVRRFAPDGWEVENRTANTGLLSGVRGSERRIIVDQSVIALYGKLQRIASDESAPPPGLQRPGIGNGVARRRAAGRS